MPTQLRNEVIPQARSTLRRQNVYHFNGAGLPMAFALANVSAPLLHQDCLGRWKREKSKRHEAPI